MKKGLLLILTVCWAVISFGSEDRITRSEYINEWKDEAVRQMVLHGIPASITLAQGILESGDGNSELARKANNHFGIKCHSDWKGKKVYHDDDRKGECFRKYPSAHQSFADHSDFLLKKRYASLFELKITDYKGWARGLKKCGYATHPKYANLLIDLIEKHDLTRFDKEGLKQIKRPDKDFTADKSDKKPKQAGGEWDENDDLPAVDLIQRRKTLLSDNRIKFVTAKEGDTIESIAQEMDVMPWQVRKYNDLGKAGGIEAGQRIYLQPKRSKAKEAWHTVKEGETMHDISQRYGIKLKHIYKKNNLTPGSKAEPGMKLSLRKRIRL